MYCFLGRFFPGLDRPFGGFCVRSFDAGQWLALEQRSQRHVCIWNGRAYTAMPSRWKRSITRLFVAFESWQPSGSSATAHHLPIADTSRLLAN
jgi:hypothetical protein